MMARSLEELLMIRCGDMRCNIVMHRQSGTVSALFWSVVKDGIGCCTFGRRWYLPEVQGGSREAQAPVEVLSG